MVVQPSPPSPPPLLDCIQIHTPAPPVCSLMKVGIKVLSPFLLLNMSHVSKSPPSLSEADCVPEFMKTSVWCFIRADSYAMWIFKARGHGQRPPSSLRVAQSYKREEKDKDR